MSLSTDPKIGLAGIALFDGLAPADLARIEKLCAWQRWAVGEMIVGQDDRNTDVIFVAAGRLKVQLYSESGQQMIFREIAAGDTLGELSAIDGRPRSASVVAAAESVTARLSAAAFLDLIDAHRSLRSAMLRKLVTIVRDLSERMFEISTLTARSRVRAHLLRLATQAGVTGNQAAISPVPVQSQMADQLATHREAVSREMSALTRAGILRRRPDMLLVHDVRKLQALVAAQQSEG